MSRRKLVLALSLICMLLAMIGLSARAADPTVEELKARVTEATKNFKDLTATGIVRDKNKKALMKVDSSYARMYEFKSASVSLKLPDKMRMEGKLGMVKVEYIICGWKKILRAPAMKLNKTEDYTGDPAKLQSALDMGIVTPQLWDNRRVEVVPDPEAQAKGEIKLKLTWLKGDMINLAWIDATNLWLKRFEKRDGRNNLQARVVYSNPQNVGGVIWLPTKVELYSGDGDKAGTTELTDIKVNTGLPDSLFN